MSSHLRGSVTDARVLCVNIFYLNSIPSAKVARCMTRGCWVKKEGEKEGKRKTSLCLCDFLVPSNCNLTEPIFSEVRFDKICTTYVLGIAKSQTIRHLGEICLLCEIRESDTRVKWLFILRFADLMRVDILPSQAIQRCTSNKQNPHWGTNYINTQRNWNHISYECRKRKKEKDMRDD